MARFFFDELVIDVLTGCQVFDEYAFLLEFSDFWLLGKISPTSREIFPKDEKNYCTNTNKLK